MFKIKVILEILQQNMKKSNHQLNNIFNSICPERKFEQQKLKGQLIQSQQSKLKQQSHQPNSQIQLPIQFESNKMIIQKENFKQINLKTNKKQTIIVQNNHNQQQHNDSDSSNDGFSIKQIIEMNKNNNSKKKNMKIDNKFKGIFEQECDI